jgi:hypothetical protein
MFRLAMSHLQAMWIYCFDQTFIINEMLARYGSNGLKMTYCESKHVAV